MSINIGHNHNIYVGQYDLKPNCPGCYSNHNVISIGTLHVDGAPNTTFQCKSCNRAFTGTTGGISQLVDIAKSETNAEYVTFTTTSGTTLKFDDSTVSNSTINGTLDAYTITNSLNNIANNTSYSYNELSQVRMEMQSLKNSIEELVETIEMLVKKNLELQSDPLLGLKKKIQDFNLQ